MVRMNRPTDNNAATRHGCRFPSDGAGRGTLLEPGAGPSLGIDLSTVEANAASRIAPTPRREGRQLQALVRRPATLLAPNSRVRRRSANPGPGEPRYP